MPIEENQKHSIPIEDAFFKIANIDSSRDSFARVEVCQGVRDVFSRLLRKGSAFGLCVEELLMALYADEYEHANRKGHDFIEKKTGRKIEVKAFTANGGKFGLSHHYGKGRSIDQKEFEESTREKDFLVCDHADLVHNGRLTFIRRSGDFIRSVGPNVSKTKKLTIFNSEP